MSHGYSKWEFVFPTTFRMFQPAPSILFPAQYYFKETCSCTALESIVNHVQSTKLSCDTAECTTNENVVTRPYHFNWSSSLIM